MRQRSWTENQLRNTVSKATSLRQVIKDLNLIPAGGNYYQIQKYLKIYNIDIGHFKGRAWNKGLHGIGKPRISLKQILVNGNCFQSFKLKKRLFAEGLKKTVM